MGKVRHDLELGYVRIHKCACTSIRHYLGERGWTSTPNEQIPREYLSFAVIRDPLDRWVSGVHELWPHATEGVGLPFATFLLNILEAQRESGEVWTMGNNGHLRPQVDFLAEVRCDVDLFPLTRFADVPRWLRDHGVAANAPIPRERYTPHGRKATAWSLITDDDRAQIRTFYAADDELHRQVSENFAWT